jgi:glycosyltransferase involved in cell wall biosynthesis
MNQKQRSMNQEPRTKIKQILVLNWRDIKNPAGGGAEILTHELAKGWVKKGHEVLVFSSWFLGAQKTETIDGVKFIRKGAWWTVHVHAFLYYLKNRNKFDLIIDEVHWFPFFAALYARKKTIALTCEVANKLFFTLFPYPIALIFRFLEKIYLYIYKNVPTMTISESTKKDLIKEGVKANLITILPMGITIPKNLKKYNKEKNPTFIYLARINKQKGIYDAIEAFASIKNKVSSIKGARLWVVGSGEDDVVKRVKKMVKEYDIQDSVKFFGFVDEKKKFELLARAHILLAPSVHEGWGLTVPEAASQKTPAIVYNVSGLRDIIVNRVTGIIVKKNTPGELAKEATKIVTNKNKYHMLQKNIIELIDNTNWNKTSEKSLKFLDKYYKI